MSWATSTSWGCDQVVPGRDRALCNAPFRLSVAREMVRMWGKARDFPLRLPSVPPPLQNPAIRNPTSPGAAPHPALLQPCLYPRAPPEHPGSPVPGTSAATRSDYAAGGRPQPPSPAVTPQPCSSIPPQSTPGWATLVRPFHVSSALPFAQWRKRGRENSGSKIHHGLHLQSVRGWRESTGMSTPHP